MELKLLALEKEKRTYQKKFKELINDRGRFVLISGSKIYGTFACYEDAIQVGYKQYGVKKPFLVKRILTAFDELCGVK